MCLSFDLKKRKGIIMLERAYGRVALVENYKNSGVFQRDFGNTFLFKDFFKQFTESIFALVILIFFSPFALYIAYRIKKESPGKVLFKQQRVGRGGKSFTCYKFRSMHESSAQGDLYTQVNDLRIFSFGHTMRKMRIDEVPQLWNVLKGEMSIVGPRAEWDLLVKGYEERIPNYSYRHLVKPGITGLAQVRYHYGINDRDTKIKLRYDLFYIEHQSLSLDLWILWRTIWIVLGRKGR